MRTILPLGAMAVLDLTEVAIHIAYGWGCWGLQPGGAINVFVVLGLAAAFLAAAAIALLSAGSLSRFVVRAGAASVALAIVIVSYATVGWRLFTSIHNQGPENLLLVAALNVGIIAVVVVSWVQPSRSLQRTTSPPR